MLNLQKQVQTDPLVLKNKNFVRAKASWICLKFKKTNAVMFFEKQIQTGPIV